MTAILSSRKFQALVAGVLVTIAVRWLGLDPTSVQPAAQAVAEAAGTVAGAASTVPGSGPIDLAALIALMVSTFIGAQGLADHGKERAKVEQG